MVDADVFLGAKLHPVCGRAGIQQRLYGRRTWPASDRHWPLPGW